MPTSPGIAGACAFGSVSLTGGNVAEDEHDLFVQIQIIGIGDPGAMDLSAKAASPVLLSW
jgi:hypothetical protein